MKEHVQCICEASPLGDLEDGRAGLLNFASCLNASCSGGYLCSLIWFCHPATVLRSGCWWLPYCWLQGGRNCTKENPAHQRTPNAIPGLHSNWVGDKILAMARPWQENVMKHDLVSRFKEANIGMILNLQEVCPVAAEGVQLTWHKMILDGSTPVWGIYCD